MGGIEEVEMAYDFTHCHVGTLVIHSEHYHDQHGTPRRSPSRKRLGMVVDKAFIQEEGAVVCYPVVHWEGAAMGHMCHPLNAVPYRSPPHQGA